MGADHVRRIDRAISGARIVAVADPDAGRAAAAAAGIKGASLHTEPLAALDAHGVDAVLVASPGDEHEQAILAAFERGLPVLCEKPMTPDAAGAQRVMEAESKTGHRLLQVGFMRRYDAEYLRLKALLDAGRLGRVLMLHCTHRNVSSPAGFTSAMMINSSVSHEIDASRWLLDQEIAAVTVLRPRPSAGAPGGLLDPQLVLFETSGGAVVDVEIFVNCGFGYQVRCEAVGETGSARIGDGHTMVVEMDGSASKEIPQDYLIHFADAYDREVQAWVDATRRGMVRGPSAWDGYATATATEAAVKAQQTGRRITVEQAKRPPLYD
jgi:myo-inositol 2-dehydrogenase/D-chiro-inositol 1-dehydrogenase